MKVNKFNKIIFLFFMVTCILYTSCSLKENNPSGFTMEAEARSSVAAYKTIVNECYYGMEQRMWACQYWMLQTEGGTDTWNAIKNSTTTNAKYFKYDLGLATPVNAFSDQWLAFYDGIGACNTAISLAGIAPFATDSARNTLVAEAYFLRAIYYFELVEQYGSLTVITKPAESVELHPLRTDPMEVYEKVILPDLEFAAKWLPITQKNLAGAVTNQTRPTRKTAMGYLALAYLQTVEYDDSKSYASKALAVSKQLMDDCNAGGATYNTYMYKTFKEVFDETNNFENKEALWSHRFILGANPRNPEQLNENDLLFNCSFTSFGACITDYFAAGGRVGQFMPTHYLLKSFIQDDGSLDPRFHQSFKTLWTCNKAYTWTTANILSFDKSTAVTTTSTRAIGDTAIVVVHPNDADYNKMVAKKHDTKYLIVDLADVYANDTIRMKYTRLKDGALVSNPFYSFFPSLIKHNSTHFVEVQANKKYANLDATFPMRMSEVYLIAAEADLYVNNGANALGYINVIRSRAGARPLTGTPTIQTILDERARELCGEYARFNDLKRTRNLTREYLMAKNPDVGQYFNNDKNKVRQIPLKFLQTLQDGGAYYQNPNY
jgi:starch-binding outer membrane protein, SusD/RagB family